MSPVRPREQVHRGRVTAAALWFDAPWLGEREARRRVLAAWTPGGEVFALGGGLLWRLPEPVRMDCATAPGLVFTHEQGVWCAAPLSPSERERLSPPPGSVVWVRAGVAQVHALGAAERVDVSAWLDTSGWTVVAVEGLGAPPLPVAVPVPVPPPSRATFGVGAAAPEAEALRARLEGRAAPEPHALVPATAPPGLLARLLGWWRARHETPASSRPPSAAPAASSEGAWSRLTAGLSRWLATATPLGTWLGRRKAAYVRRLFDLFDEGALEEALRYAIPLGKGELSESTRVSLDLPGPRETLAVQPLAGGGRTVFGGGEALYDALRERYRGALRKLEREGRIEEAAFVLAELLHEAEEAVSLLERHGRPRLAAELAEGRGLAPGLVVRQWLLARDVARAVDVARRTGAFEDAIGRLACTHPTDARALRLLWGEVLASAGAYGRAADVVWPVVESRGLARVWLERAVEAGGGDGAQALARLLLAFPERLEDLRPRLHALWEGEGRHEAQARLRFLRALADSSEGGEVRTLLLRESLRGFMRDVAAEWVLFEPREFERLVQAMKDPVLAAELPALSPRVPVPSQPMFLSFAEETGGPWPLHDAVPLAEGRVLVALGERGARLLSPEGRCVAHFDVPAFSLVLSWEGDRALALAPRGGLHRVSRLDLVRRRATTWCDLRVDAFSPEYDGSLWFVAERDTVLALDALADEPRALWRVTDVGGPVVALTAGTHRMSFVCAHESFAGPLLLERWAYELREGPTLRARHVVSAAPKWPVFPHLSLLANGELAVTGIPGARLSWLAPADNPQLVPPKPPEEGDLLRVHLGIPWIATLEARPAPAEGLVLGLWDRSRGQLLARVSLEGAHPEARVRRVGNQLVFFDARGWLLHMENAHVLHRIIPR
ncbi:bpX6 domain-containing protein [Archangium primigenium]|uniref:bpX6 domain-containing protein n=1 Tax=[Archangium] primigenium TaxID=2792470 RepID=UPI00195789E2|nr:bpX6 domain-containing protein [Archangium primigenium]MBM7112977.1 hypothetical protein [Archangium primigenium]